MKSIKALVPVAGLIVLGGCSETAQTVVEENWLGDASIGTINGNDVPSPCSADWHSTRYRNQPRT